jgi:hypothetical protein
MASKLWTFKLLVPFSFEQTKDGIWIAFSTGTKGCVLNILGRQTIKKAFDEEKAWRTRVLDLVHSDLGKTMKITSIFGTRYFPQVEDDFT